MNGATIDRLKGDALLFTTEKAENLATELNRDDPEWTY